MNLRLFPLLGILLTGAAHAQQAVGLEGAAAQANLNALTAGAPAVIPRGKATGWSALRTPTTAGFRPK